MLSYLPRSQRFCGVTAPHRQYSSVLLPDGEVSETAVNIAGCSSAVMGFKPFVFDILLRAGLFRCRAVSCFPGCAD
jgi:hypothetical protein